MSAVTCGLSFNLIVLVTYHLTGVQDTESLMAAEMTSIQEVVDSLCLLASDPCHLPASSQQVIDDYQRTQCKWFCQV